MELHEGGSPYLLWNKLELYWKQKYVFDLYTRSLVWGKPKFHTLGKYYLSAFWRLNIFCPGDMSRGIGGDRVYMEVH